jgi:hypothetical protein
VINELNLSWVEPAPIDQEELKAYPIESDLEIFDLVSEHSQIKVDGDYAMV